jgi:hypothetical protein
VVALQDAAQMQSVMGSRKPNCIIVDEVDGTAGDGCTTQGPKCAGLSLANCRIEFCNPLL